MAKRQKATLGQSLGKRADKAVKDHRSDPVDYGSGGSLPAGIEGGVAELTSCYFSQFEKGNLKGKWFWRASGVVKEPDSYDGRKVAGKHTSIMEPLCDTPGRKRETAEDHLEWVMNELKKLGGDDLLEDVESVDDLPDICEELVEEGIHFGFRTWQGQPTGNFPNPRVQETWEGALAEYEEDESEDKVDTREDEEEEEDTEDTTDDAESGKEEDDEEDILALGAMADEEGDDSDAAVRLVELAKEASLDPDEYGTWMDLAETIFEADDQPEEEEDDDSEEKEESSQPDKGDILHYKPKGKRKPIEVEVTGVFTKKEAANVQSLDDGTKYKSVPWSELVEIE